MSRHPSIELAATPAAPSSHLATLLALQRSEDPEKPELIEHAKAQISLRLWNRTATFLLHWGESPIAGPGSICHAAIYELSLLPSLSRH